MRTYHWIDFETVLMKRDHPFTVRVEATISSNGNGVEIEGVKVKLIDSLVEVVLSDSQMQDVCIEVLERCNSVTP